MTDVKALVQGLLDHITHTTCQHDNVRRDGSIWTICDDCGDKWADGQGGFQPYVAPEIVTQAEAWLEEERTVNQVPEYHEGDWLDYCPDINGVRPEHSLFTIVSTHYRKTLGEGVGADTKLAQHYTSLYLGNQRSHNPVVKALRSLLDDVLSVAGGRNAYGMPIHDPEHPFHQSVRDAHQALGLPFHPPAEQQKQADSKTAIMPDAKPETLVVLDHLDRGAETLPGGVRLEDTRRIVLSEKDQTMAAQWTPDDMRAAESQGWCLSNYDDSGALQLQCRDDSEIFASDDEAIAFVRDQAIYGWSVAIRERCSLALRLDRYFEPIIYGPNYVSKIHPTGGRLRPGSRI